jgi:hypothetical protein
MGSSLVLWALGDAISQTLDEKQRHQFSKARLFGTAMEGCLIGGGVGSLWYMRLHHIVSHTLKLRESSVRFVLAKLGLECLFWQPALTLSFWVFVGLVEGHPLPKIRRELEHDFLPSLLSEYALFAPLDIVNFRLVPVQYQVAEQMEAHLQSIYGLSQCITSLSQSLSSPTPASCHTHSHSFSLTLPPPLSLSLSRSLSLSLSIYIYIYIYILPKVLVSNAASLLEAVGLSYVHSHGFPGLAPPHAAAGPAATIAEAPAIADRVPKLEPVYIYIYICICICIYI